jgi:hypothetical protein
MGRSVRWFVTAVVIVMTFGSCLWAGHGLSWDWLPDGEAERWGVAATFATVVAGAVGAPLGWWAGRERSARLVPVLEGDRVLRARAVDSSVVDQAAGSRGPDGAAVKGRVEMDADASGHGRIRQTGGDDTAGGA